MELSKILPVLIFVIHLICVLSLVEAKSNATSDINKILCTEPKCIMKCCPLGKYLTTIKVGDLRRRICGYFDNTTRDFPFLANNLFAKYPEIANLNFTIKDGIFEVNETFKTDSVSVFGWFNVYLTDLPEVHLEMPNAYKRWTKIPNSRFCWDFKINRAKTGVNPGIWVMFPVNENEPSRTSTTLLTTAMLVSCFFLLVVLVVYSVLPELRNLCGQILMAYVGSLFFAFLLLVVMRIKQHDESICPGLSFTIYYFFMASFCWMHVMSYDIWWTFRGYAKARPIHRRGENFKFLMYCLYAFGLPLAMSITLAVLNSTNMSHIPWFVTPKIPANGCFIEGGEKLYYLYIPMLILILCNWAFYLMTAFNVWRLSRGTAVLDSAAAGTPHAHRTQRHRFMVYLKLSAVMGLNWILELVSSLYPGYNAWFISDFYNILIGVTIFLIFVCKKKILRKLVKRYIRCKTEWRPGQKDSMKSTTSTSDSSSSQETQTLQVCGNPKGPGYSLKVVEKAQPKY